VTAVTEDGLLDIDGRDIVAAGEHKGGCRRHGMSLARVAPARVSDVMRVFVIGISRPQSSGFTA